MIGVFWILGILAVLLPVLWGPTVVLVRLSDAKFGLKKLIFLLLGELAVVVFLVFMANLVGLTNPGGIIFISTVSVSLIGAFLTKTKLKEV